MKTKKKLLIAMAAMSVAAIGAGTVSTFAWYTAQSTAALQAVEKFGTINTAVNGNVTGLQVTIGYSATTADAPDLSDDAGSAKYWVGSARNANNGDPTGTLTFSANTTGVSGADKALLRNHKYSAYVKGEGNVKILSGDSDASDATGVAKYTVSTTDDTEGLLVYISFSDAADPAVTVSLTDSNYAESITLNYAVRTNNPNGLEYMCAAENTGSLQDKGQVIKATNDANIGDATVGYDPDTYHVQEKAMATWGNMDNTGFIHSLADKISVGAAEQLL